MKHRYNAREEEMLAETRRRRVWAFQRRQMPKRRRDYTALFESFTFPGATVEKVDAGVYVYEWRNEPLDKPANEP